MKESGRRRLVIGVGTEAMSVPKPAPALPEADPTFAGGEIACRSACRASPSDRSADHGGWGGQMDILDARKSEPWRGGASFALGNRLYRLVWAAAWRLLASWTPPSLVGWRRLLLRLFGARVAPTANIYSSARIWSPANLEVGDFACIGPAVTVYAMAKVIFAPYSLASQGAHFCAGAHDIEDVHFQLQARPIVIGYRAWIAAEAFVGPGVTVGEGAVLGARGCAFRDLDPWTVYVGNPARAIKQRRVRFPDDVKKAVR
jgi:putative colanic acid biosynthesis acetyltransferase WcaF